MAILKRHDGRRAGEMRPCGITPDFVSSADGSCLIEVGGTRVICTACFEAGVPKWRQGSGMGWVTAEYAMLPASTSRRKKRATLKPDSRGVEIQRFIGRVLRSVVRLDKLGENTVHLDCDVLEADGGTRTASVTGAYVALVTALDRCARRDLCPPGVLSGVVAAVSVAIVQGRIIIDPDYVEDSSADVDMNIAMLGAGRFVEIQGTGERKAFSPDELDQMLAMARKGIRKLNAIQRQAIKGITGK